MSLTDEELDRLADVVRLQPTKNAALEAAWGVDGGSEVHRYLENHLKEYYYRDDDSLIRATAAANDLVDVEPGIEADAVARGVAPERIAVPQLEARVFEVVAGPEERSQSVVSVLNSLRETFDIDPEAGAVRRALRSLERKHVVEVVYRTVPTFRLAVERDSVAVAVNDGDAKEDGGGGGGGDKGGDGDGGEGESGGEDQDEDEGKNKDTAKPNPEPKNDDAIMESIEDEFAELTDESA